MRSLMKMLLHPYHEPELKGRHILISIISALIVWCRIIVTL